MKRKEKIVKRALLCIVLVAGSTFANAQSSPNRLYQDLVKSVNVLQGNIYLNLSAGVWKSKLPTGQALILRFDDNSVVETQVNYAGGVLRSASMTFRPAIHVWVKDPAHGFSAAIDSISFDNLGEASPHLTIDNGNTANPNLVASLDRGLRLSRTPDGVLLGTPFTSLPTTQRCSDQAGNSCAGSAPLISEVRFEELDAAHPGLRVVLQDRASLHFSSASADKTFDNAVTLGDSSGFNFRQIDYVTDQSRLFADLTDFKASVSSGILKTRDVSLVLNPGSVLQFQHLILNKNGASATVDAKSGSLSAMVGVGSSVNLSSGKNASSLTFANGSQINLQGFSIGVEDKQKTIFSVGGGSTLTAQIALARLGIGTDGFVSLSSGTLAANLVGNWDSSGEDGPQTSLDISLLEGTIYGGVVDLNPDSHLKISSGNVKATDLTFRGVEFAGLVGTISSLNLALQDGTHFGVPSGLQILTAPGATFAAATPADPLVFAVGAKFPTGVATLHLPFTELRDAKLGTFVIRNGTADIAVANRTDGSIDGAGGSFSGTGVFASGDLALTAVFNVANVTIAKSPGKAPIIQGTFNGTIKPVDITYTSSPIYRTPGHDDLRIYPITAELKVTNDVTLPPSLLRFDGTGFTITAMHGEPIDIPLKAQFIIPNGRGEHQQPDYKDDTADGTHGPNDDTHGNDQIRQEVLTDTYTKFRVHFYVKADTYNATAVLHLIANGSTMSVSLDSMKLDHAIGWDKDGLDAEGLLAVLTGAVATIFFGPAGTVIGVAAGYVAGGDINNLITSRINAVIIEKIQGLQGSWRFQL